MIRFLLHTLLVLSVLVGFGATPILAVENADFDIATIASADEELTADEKFAKAYDGVNRALSLSLDRVNSLTNELTKRTFDDESVEKEMQDGFLINLATYDVYYTEKIEILAKFSTLLEIQELAKEVKEYRDSTYSPAMEGIVEFTLIFYNEDVIRVAEERFERVMTDVNELQTLGFLNDVDFVEEFANIDTLLETSNKLQITAKESILNPSATSSLEESVIVTKTTAIEASALIASSSIDIASSTVDTEEEGEEILAEELIPETPREMLETSLSKIKEVYVVFIEVSEGIKNILGLN